MIDTVYEHGRRFRIMTQQRIPNKRRTQDFVKQHVGVVDRVEVRFVRGVPRFQRVASRVEGMEGNNSRVTQGVNNSVSYAKSNSEEEAVLTVDGAPVFGRAVLRPGVIVQIGGLEYEVLRDVRAHA
tara:strand:- start:20537 stop:20914 length:378 start_codon:yes stop_codon:yes gene_type:complete